mgnify:CR=1 FL=1|jgi:hypothetical protein
MRSCEALVRQDDVSRVDASACGSLTVRRHRVLAYRWAKTEKSQHMTIACHAERGIIAGGR